MADFLIAVPTMILVLGVMIVVHEFGHYAVAKMCGVRVLVFSVGFGKRLIGFTRGDTDYRVSALPFGGYVKMAGENPMEDRSGDPGEFMSHPRWQRILIALAGPAMNILLAIAILTGVFMVHYEHSPIMDKPIVVGIVDPNSPAAISGIQVGDHIIRIQDKLNPVWRDINEALLQAKLSPNTPITLNIQRGSQIFNAQVLPQDRTQELGYIGISPDLPTQITRIEPDMPAYQVGLRIGDEIKSLDETPVGTITAIQAYLQKTGSKPINVHIVRKGQAQTFTATPVIDKKENRYRLGFGSSFPIEVTHLPFMQAVSLSMEENGKLSLMIVKILQKLVSHEVSIKQMDGPIGIGKQAGQAVQQEGWIPLLILMAGISVNLGVFNLLPIPILDGGLIVLTLFESVIRRDINQQVKERIYQTAFVFIVLFAAVVIYNDISKLGPFARYLP